MNPLQDLVNNLANASVASKRAQNSANRYAQMEALPHLALDDQPNIGSAVVSPGAHSLGSVYLQVTWLLDSSILTSATLNRLGTFHSIWNLSTRFGARGSMNPACSIS